VRLPREENRISQSGWVLLYLDCEVDVAVLPRACAAEAIGFKSDDIQREVTIEQT